MKTLITITIAMLITGCSIETNEQYQYRRFSNLKEPLMLYKESVRLDSVYTVRIMTGMGYVHVFDSCEVATIVAGYYQAGDTITRRSKNNSAKEWEY